MAKKIQKSEKKKIQQAVVSEHLQEMISPDMLTKIMVEIASSPLSDDQKAVFLYAIAVGTFNLDLYETYQKMVEEYRVSLEKRAEELQQKIRQLEQKQADLSQQLAQASVGACREIQSAVVHVENSAIAQIETISEEAASKEIESLRSKLKNK